MIEAILYILTGVMQLAMELCLSGQLARMRNPTPTLTLPLKGEGILRIVP